MQPLEGLKVLDLSQFLSGPRCAQLLGDMGADVIKLEPPGKIKSPAPDLGQHNAEVYKEFLGMSEADVEELKKERVI